MSVKHFNRSNNGFYDIFSSILLIIIVFTSIYSFPCGAQKLTHTTHNAALDMKQSFTQRLFKRSSGKRCHNTTECASDLEGSICIQNTCVCPQGILPNRKGTIGCFQVGKQLGNFCNISAQCGEELNCKNHVCLCPEGFQFFHIQGANMCLLWHKPTRYIDRCRTNEDCIRQDVNTVCKKHFCRCNDGYQLFETMLFGRKQKCFKTFKQQCHNSSECSKVAETPDQYCMCLYGVCHCLTDVNSTSLDIPMWAEKPNWYQRWKKDLILATRLLFITVILFFVPCFIYVTLGVRERSRQLFSQFVQPTRSPAVHYSQRRMSQLRPLRSYRGLADVGAVPNNRGEIHRVEISLYPNGINSRLVDSRPRLLPPLYFCESNRDLHSQESDNAKEEDPPPSYDEIMRREMYPEVPPPSYREI